MSRPARWALSPLDCSAHLLLPVGEHPQGVLKTRCGHRLPTIAAVHDHPPGLVCSQCAVIFFVDYVVPRLGRKDGPR